MSESPLPPDPPYQATEIEMLTSFLDFQRGVMLRKIEGLDDVGLRFSPVASGTSLGGLLKHLGYVERFWFSNTYAAKGLSVPWTDEDPDADFRVVPDDTAESLIDFYLAECQRSREFVTADPGLERTVSASRNRTISLRWILIHMIEETARHAGHADILREIHDGKVGD